MGEQGLARAGLAGQHVQARREPQLGLLHQQQILDAQLMQHGERCTTRPDGSRSARQPAELLSQTLVERRAGICASAPWSSANRAAICSPGARTQTGRPSTVTSTGSSRERLWTERTSWGATTSALAVSEWGAMNDTTRPAHPRPSPVPRWRGCSRWSRRESPPRGRRIRLARSHHRPPHTRDRRPACPAGGASRRHSIASHSPRAPASEIPGSESTSKSPANARSATCRRFIPIDRGKEPNFPVVDAEHRPRFPRKCAARSGSCRRRQARSRCRQSEIGASSSMPPPARPHACGSRPDRI